MNHPEYWRSTAWFGVAAAILLMLFFFGAALMDSENFDDDGEMPAGGLTVILVSATLPDTLNLLFFLGFTLIMIPAEDIFTRQFLFILNGVGYTFTLLGNILITVNLEIVNPRSSGIEQMVDGAFQLSHVLYGLFLLVLVVKWHPAFPTYMRGMAVIAAISQFLLALYFTETEDINPVQAMLNIATAIWITMVAAFLLVEHQKYTPQNR